MRIWSEVEFYMHFPHLKKIKFLWTSNPITRTCKLASALWLFISNYPGRTKALKFPTDWLKKQAFQSFDGGYRAFANPRNKS